MNELGLGLVPNSPMHCWV